VTTLSLFELEVCLTVLILMHMICTRTSLEARFLKQGDKVTKLLSKVSQSAHYTENDSVWTEVLANEFDAARE
jgi:hypothetical protein